MIAFEQSKNTFQTFLDEATAQQKVVIFVSYIHKNMRLIGNVIIDERKIREYLLVWKANSDKSKFLNSLGYVDEHWRELQTDIKSIVENNDAELSKQSPFGGFLYRVIGSLRGSKVFTVWLWYEDEIKFVTLFPV